jgi:hypothetical protein
MLAAEQAFRSDTRDLGIWMEITALEQRDRALKHPVKLQGFCKYIGREKKADATQDVL